MVVDHSKDEQALNLRRAGVGVQKIVEQCGFRSRKSCLAAIDRAMEAQGIVLDPIAVRRQELDRLDRLQMNVWAKAQRGDLAAVDKVVKLTEMRLRIAGIQEAGLTPLTAQFDRTLESLAVDRELDAALIGVGRRLCEQIDAASGLGDPVAVTKALYLVPHVVNVLRELGATPSARAEFRGGAPAEPVEDDLAAMRKQLAGG